MSVGHLCFGGGMRKVCVAMAGQLTVKTSEVEGRGMKLGLV